MGGKPRERQTGGVSAADEKCLIFFCEIDASADRAADVEKFGIIIEDGEKSLIYRALDKDASGRFGVALYRVPAGSYSVKAYVETADGYVYSSVRNVVVE